MTPPRHPQHRNHRRGVVTLEVLGVVPILLVFAVSIAEFSMAMRLHHRVAFASRYGAKLASEAPRAGAGSLGLLNAQAGPDSLKARIDHWLGSTGLSPSAAVQIEHNACGVPNPVQRLTDPRYASSLLEDSTPLPEARGLENVCFVRVTVWLPLDRNLPNALKSLGLDWSGSTIRHSTVFRLEVDNQPPVPHLELMTDRLPQGYRVAETSATTPAGNGPHHLRILAERDGSLELTFSARGSRDWETSRDRLAYHWSSSAETLGGSRQSTFRSRLQLAPGARAAEARIQLDVTDGCGCSSRVELPVELINSDSI